MTQTEMLEALDLTEAELKNLLHRFKFFLDYLDEPQQKAVKRSLPKLEEALKAFGPSVTKEELLKLFGADEQHPPVILIQPCRLQKSRR